MKIHILTDLKEGPWGGGNQFLKGLRNQFINLGVYEKNPDKADIILFNSFPFGELYRFKQAVNLKKSGKILIHRVDGPISSVRDKDYLIDKIIYYFNCHFIDGTIFQSNWSRQENYKLGMKKNKFETTIINAPDNKIFNRKGRIKFSPKRKIKLIATSWSDNWRKGFRIYRYLDRNLDSNKYEMTFIGNSPINFKKIRWIKPLSSRGIAEQLKKHDIFITASQKDPCSNSLIEALHCGLPAIVLNDGGHPEIIGQGGLVFSGKSDVVEKINHLAKNYSLYQAKIDLPSIDVVAKNYYCFCQKVFKTTQKIGQKRVAHMRYLQLQLMVKTMKLNKKFSF